MLLSESHDIDLLIFIHSCLHTFIFRAVFNSILRVVVVCTTKEILLDLPPSRFVHALQFPPKFLFEEWVHIHLVVVVVVGGFLTLVGRVMLDDGILRLTQGGKRAWWSLILLCGSWR